MTYDLKINFLDDDANQLAFSFGNPSKKVDGLEKLALQWVKALLTEIGSDRLDPQYGSSFPYLLTASGNGQGINLRMLVDIALDEASDSIRRLQRDRLDLEDVDTFDDHAVLQLVVESRTSLAVTVSLYNALGENILLRVSG